MAISAPPWEERWTTSPSDYVMVDSPMAPPYDHQEHSPGVLQRSVMAPPYSMAASFSSAAAASMAAPHFPAMAGPPASFSSSSPTAMGPISNRFMQQHAAPRPAAAHHMAGMHLHPAPLNMDSAYRPKYPGAPPPLLLPPPSRVLLGNPTGEADGDKTNGSRRPLPARAPVKQPNSPPIKREPVVSTRAVAPIVTRDSKVAEFGTPIDILMKTIQAKPESETLKGDDARTQRSRQRAWNAMIESLADKDKPKPKGKKKTAPAKQPRAHATSHEFKCRFPDCGQTFPQSTHLKIHWRSHSGEKPYVSPLEAPRPPGERDRRTDRRQVCTFPGCGARVSQLGNLRVRTPHLPTPLSHPFC